MSQPTSRRRLLALLPALAVPAALAACASPEPALYALAVMPGTTRPAGRGTLKLRRIGLAGYLDRPQIVRTGSDYRLVVDSGERWGEPVDDMMARILAEDLTQRLPGRTVFTSAGTLSADADATVEIDLQRLDADGTGTVTLLAQVAVDPSRGRQGGVRTVRLTSPAGGSATPSIVAAMSKLVGQLADQIAAMPGVP